MRKPVIGVSDLDAAYRAWPGPEYDKTILSALIVRVRIERLAEALPRSIIASTPDSTQVRRRLLLSVGEPGLSAARQDRRRRVVLAAASAYDAICALLHGRTSEPHPSLHDVTAWTVAADDLEDELSLRPYPVIAS